MNPTKYIGIRKYVSYKNNNKSEKYNFRLYILSSGEIPANSF